LGEAGGDVAEDLGVVAEGMPPHAAKVALATITKQIFTRRFSSFDLEVRRVRRTHAGRMWGQNIYFSSELF
jgi:hypothetical protein